MELTKRGVSPVDVIKTATCTTCKSEYKFTLRDPEIKNSYADQRDQRERSYKYFICQVCQSSVIVRE